jgi:hypothetical protein
MVLREDIQTKVWNQVWGNTHHIISKQIRKQSWNASLWMIHSTIMTKVMEYKEC